MRSVVRQQHAQAMFGSNIVVQKAMSKGDSATSFTRPSARSWGSGLVRRATSRCSCYAGVGWTEKRRVKRRSGRSPQPSCRGELFSSAQFIP